MFIDPSAEITTSENALNNNAVNEKRYKGLLVAGIVLSVALIPFLGQFFVIFDRADLDRLIFSDFLKWGIVGLMFLYARKAEVTPFQLWPEVRYNIFICAGFVIALFLMGNGAALIAHIPRYLGLRENNAVMLKVAMLIKRYPVLLVFTCITAGATEELIFRGYMLSRLSILFKGRHWPVIISALIFAVMHIGYKTVSEMIFVFLYGLIFGYHYQRYRNIAVLMIAHFFTDFMAFGLFYMHK